MKSTQELIDEIEKIIWVIEEGPAHVKLTEAVTRLVALKGKAGKDNWSDFYELQAQRMMIERDAALRELKQHKATDVSVDKAVAKTLQYLNAELDKKDAEIQRLTAHDDAIRWECAKKARNAILSFGKGDTVSSRYSPMIRKDTAAQIAERVILGTDPAREES